MQATTTAARLLALLRDVDPYEYADVVDDETQAIRDLEADPTQALDWLRGVMGDADADGGDRREAIALYDAIKAN